MPIQIESPAVLPQPSPTGSRVRSFVALMYHNVVADGQSHPELSPSATSYFVSRSAFSRQLTELLNPRGAVPMSLDSLAAFYAKDFNAPAAGQRGALITFDDGWAGTVDIGGPLLEQHGLESFLFVTTDFIDKPLFLPAGDISRLPRRVFRIGSHARSHRMLSLLSEPEIRSELTESKKRLEDLTGYEVDAISIPSGAVDLRVRRIAGESGYRFLFDSEVRINSRREASLSIGRVGVMRDTDLATFRRYADQKIGKERVRRAVLQAPKRLLGLRRYEAIRRRLLGEKGGQRVTHKS